MLTQLAVASEYGDKWAEKKLREDLLGFQKHIEAL
jgi:hypothetical protein